MPRKEDKGITEEFSYILPKEGQKLTVYAEFLQSLQQKARHYNRCLGEVSWVTGKVLLLARPLCKKPGDWSQFLNTISVGPGKKLKPGTARLMMKIADVVDEEEAKRWSYSGMLARIYPDTYGKDIKSDLEDADDGQQSTKRVKNRKSRIPNAKTPLTVTAFEKTTSKILLESQRLNTGFADSGKHLDKEVEMLRNARRCVDSALNELGDAKNLVEKRITYLTTETRKEAA